jgi:hypothetical protein
MGKNVLSAPVYRGVHEKATAGGTRSATFAAEETFAEDKTFDPLVDPKGLEHLGPIRRSMPRFVKDGDLWRLTIGIPMAEETLLDTTASMGNNVDLAFAALLGSYEMYTSGTRPLLAGYDVQIATATFNDVDDNRHRGTPVILRSQFEMEEKIALQMAMLIPGRGGAGNHKEDPHFGLFGAAYLTAAGINRYGLKSYHFLVSDELVPETISLSWLQQIFGDEVLTHCAENGFEFKPSTLPDTAQVVSDLQTRAHAFFLHVTGHGDHARVVDLYKELYGPAHFVTLPRGTENLHAVKAAIVGLTEGVLDLQTAEAFLVEHKVRADAARQIVRAVSHIPLGAQMEAEHFGKLPKAGDIFKQKTDLWPMDASDVPATPAGSGEDGDSGWV